MTLVIGFEDFELVCFRALQMEHLRGAEFRVRDFRQSLGPDLIASDVEIRLDEILQRARALLPPDATVADLLLDQRIASGLGNVYMSERLFIRGIKPNAPVASADDVARAGLFRLGARLLQANVGPATRRTRFATDGRGPLWVYGRAHQPCLECGARIENQKMGRHLLVSGLSGVAVGDQSAARRLTSGV